MNSRIHKTCKSESASLPAAFDGAQSILDFAKVGAGLIQNHGMRFFKFPNSSANDVRPDFHRSLGIGAWLIGSTGFSLWPFYDTSSKLSRTGLDDGSPKRWMLYGTDFRLRSSRLWREFKHGISYCSTVRDAPGGELASRNSKAGTVPDALPDEPSIRANLIDNPFSSLNDRSRL